MLCWKQITKSASISPLRWKGPSTARSNAMNARGLSSLQILSPRRDQARCSSQTIRHDNNNSSHNNQTRFAFPATRRVFSTPSHSQAGAKSFGAFHFGTTEYAACFQGLPHPNPDDLRRDAVEYLDTKFDPQVWYDDPVQTVVGGKVSAAANGNKVDTYSALGDVNGQQVLATPQEMQQVQEHIASLSGLQDKDLRDAVRGMEQDLFTSASGELITNQCVDFAKQDGVTEMEELIQACVVERRLNDYLLLEEKRGRVAVNRKPIYVTCVSNFTHFLDLSRKVLRSLEVGIPVVVLGRAPGPGRSAQQHSYRWFQKLVELAPQHGLDGKYLSFVSATLEDTRDLLQATQAAGTTGNLYMTGSRQGAQDMRRLYKNTIASTGGPNTMVLSTPNQVNPKELSPDEIQQAQEEAAAAAEKEGKDIPQLEKNPMKKSSSEDLTPSKQESENEEPWFSPELKAAICTSAAIESAGQCTALRHVIVPPDFTPDDVSELLRQGIDPVESPQEALRSGKFDGLFVTKDQKEEEGQEKYKHDAKTDTRWRLNDSLPESSNPAKAAAEMPEYWRKVVVDYTKLRTDPWNYTNLDKLAHWLNQTQPISLAVNGNMVDSYKNMRRLFDRTALAVYTVGGRSMEPIMGKKRFPPALTCQARPQEGEIFGEVPPRHILHETTKFPVYIPSSNPSYDTTYTAKYLQQQQVGASWLTSSKELLEAIESPEVRGYCCLLINYLQNVDDDNPKIVPTTSQARTVLWGLQRPPLQCKTVIRCGASTSWDTCAPAVVLFHVTTAREQLQISVAPENKRLIDFFDQHGLKEMCIVESDAELERRVKEDLALEEKSSLFQVTDVDKPDQYPLYFNSEEDLFFPMPAQFTSLFFPMGHVKSTAADDQEFIMRMQGVSRKWLGTLF